MSKTPLRVIFAGTPDFAALHLKALINSEHQLTAVYTQPDRPAGRGKKLQASAVKKLALEAALPVYQPASLKGAETQQALAALNADVMIVVAYGLLLPQAVLDATRLGCLNVHASLLPRWRGAAPIQRAIEAGDKQTGITIMQMDAGLDTGDMLATVSCPIGPATSAASLHDELAQLGPDALLQVLEDLPEHFRHREKQPEEGTSYAKKITKSEAALDWNASATSLDRSIRAFNPFPVCYSYLDTDRVRIWQALPIAPESGEDKAQPGEILRVDNAGILVACGQGQLLIEVLQFPGGKALPVLEVARGHPQQFTTGARFITTPADQT